MTELEIAAKEYANKSKIYVGLEGLENIQSDFEAGAKWREMNPIEQLVILRSKLEAEIISLTTERFSAEFEVAGRMAETRLLQTNKIILMIDELLEAV